MPKLKFGKLRTIFRGRIFTIEQQTVTAPGGKKAVFEYARRPTSVSVLAFDHRGWLLLIRERRVGYNKNIWFLPGGRADHPGDTPKKAALRELREETGYGAKIIRLVHKKSPSNTLHWDIFLYAAKDLYWSPLPKDLGEKTKPYFIPFKKAVRMALDGTIENEFIAYNIIRFNYMVRHKQFKW